MFIRIRYKTEMPENIDDDIGKRRSTTLLIFAIIMTIATTVLCCVIIFLRKRIELVIALFKEAGKAVGRMPLLLFEPILV